jgi:hypothetical protein
LLASRLILYMIVRRGTYFDVFFNKKTFECVFYQKKSKSCVAHFVIRSTTTRFSDCIRTTHLLYLRTVGYKTMSRSSDERL